MCLLLASLTIPLAARAEHTRFWRESEYTDFEKGTAKGVAVRNDGKLMPAPNFAEFSDPNLAYLWALRVDSHGRLYAAGGSDARVVRFDETGKAVTVFDSPELAAQALAFDSRDNLYVGTSPDGRVYKVTPEGRRSVFFEPKTKYIWALAVGPNGILYVATGDKGEVFGVAPDGKGQVFYKSDERHARSLAFDSKGDLLIGTDPNGLIVRVEILRKKDSDLSEAGAAYVVYETNKKEVTSLLTDPSGTIYAAAVGEKARATPPTLPAPSLMFEGIPNATLPGQKTTVAPLPGAPQVPSLMPQILSVAGGSEVDRIAPDGSPESVWKSREELVYSLGFSLSGKLLFGTGNRGEIAELEGDGLFSVLAKTASAQVTSIAPGANGTRYLATANPGKIFTLGPGYAPEGTFESNPFDAKIFSQWGRLNWWGEESAAGGKVAFYVRSGNTSNPEKNWSSWAGPYSNAAGEPAGCPPARFVQWKAVFSRAASGEAPSISWVSLAYLPKNVAPVIDSIVLQSPGVRVQGFLAPAPNPPGAAAPVPLRMPQTKSGGAAAPPTPTVEFPQRPKVEMPLQGLSQKGYQSVLWSTHDDNDDDLAFSLYYRGEGEQNWKLLKDKIEQHFYTWDTTSMPDGAYYLKLVASDAPSNPLDEALSTERESDRFEVDNTPPAVENLRAEKHSSEVRISFEARDSSSLIIRAEYSLDAGDWETVFPAGRLADSPVENYVVPLRKLSPGEHTFAVRVTDRFENTASAKLTFTLASHPAP